MREMSDETAERWRRRPVLARAYRGYVLAGPLLMLVGVTFLASQVVSETFNPLATLARWALIAGMALGSALVADNVLSRLLPIAALLDLDLGFPGATPTRSRIASLASLRGGDAELMDLLPGAAEHDLDASAEHVIISYAATVRAGVRPRSHLARVRAVAMRITDGLSLADADRDRLQWALLLREIGTIGGEHGHPHAPMVRWLGPWAALLHGPFLAAADSAEPLAVRTGAHAAAVADAYVVVTAAHPYHRALSGGSWLPLEAMGPEPFMPRVVDALVALSVHERRRAAGFASGVSSALARYSPSPQPALALASVLAVVAFVIGGVGPAPSTSMPTQVTAAEAAPPARMPTQEQLRTYPSGIRRAVMTEIAEGANAPSPADRQAAGARVGVDPVPSPQQMDAVEQRAAAYAAGDAAMVAMTGSTTAPPDSGRSRDDAPGASSRPTASGSGTSSGSTPTPTKTATSSPKQTSPAPAPEPAPEPDPAPAPEPDPEPAPDPEPEPAPEPEPESDPDP